MRKIFIIGLISIALMLGGCSNQNTVAVKNTPHQVGQKGEMSASVNAYDLEKVYKKADLVAEIKITEWLEEMDEPAEKTLFKAKLEKVYKNNQIDNPEEIYLLQDGNSKYTIKDYPLFKNDDKLILFMKKAEEAVNTFWILGVNTCVIRVVDVAKESYAVKQVGQFREFLNIRAENADSNLREALLKDYKVEFPNSATILPEAYGLKALESELEKMKSEVEKD
ncbi:hypothetical protein CLHUN_39640 [Ruminiclostridium hungatei]|uniref:Lipoprotein n=1 Tax=Ruminiclostridium hungatei TaxID=48256 RepID=A0A1V4SFX6_RUMHU|nr:hypothetical protein [Ruminiclostridium hungatei]OPX42177.1 hypothetical protein CLHUN_39640 [Ruminiclostridium hungatei]